MYDYHDYYPRNYYSDLDDYYDDYPDPGKKSWKSQYNKLWRDWLETGEGDMFLQGDANTLAVLDSLVMGTNRNAKAILAALASFTDEEWALVDKIMDAAKEIRPSTDD